MSKMILDKDLQTKLNNLNEVIELCNEDGDIVGHILPVEEYKKLLYGSLQIPYSEDEIKRRRAESGGSTLTEIWQRLGPTRG